LRSLALLLSSFKGSQIREGDIIYMSGAYTTLYKGKMILYQGLGLLRGNCNTLWIRKDQCDFKDWRIFLSMEGTSKCEYS